MLMRQVMTERLAIPVKDPMTEVNHANKRPDD